MGSIGIRSTDSARLGCEMQPRRRRIHGDGLDTVAHEGRELLLEFASLGAGREPSGPHHGCRRCDLFLADEGPEARYSDGGGTRP